MAMTDVIENEKLGGFRRALIGFLAFDSDLHFIKFSRKGGEASIFTVADLSEPFVPFKESLLVHASEYKSQILSFLEMMPRVFERGNKGGSCLIKALDVAHATMKSVGGRIIVTCTSSEIAGDVEYFSYSAEDDD